MISVVYRHVEPCERDCHAGECPDCAEVCEWVALRVALYGRAVVDGYE